MSPSVEKIAQASGSSLTLIVDDLARQRRDAAIYPDSETPDLDDWLNALQRQATPLVHSRKGLANLEAWLEAVDLDTATPVP
ncbi:MAG: hypothetical protein EXR11_04835 [Rhodospirillaceae bacterium]|nr:hypothetical protein [Rhodospirillaceae bacterium]